MWGRYLREKPQWLPKPQRGFILGFLFKKNSQHPSLLVTLVLLLSSAGCASIKAEMPTEYVATEKTEPEVTPEMREELTHVEAEFGTELDEMKSELEVGSSEAKAAVAELKSANNELTQPDYIVRLCLIAACVVTILIGLWSVIARKRVTRRLLTGEEITDDIIRARYKAIREGYVPPPNMEPPKIQPVMGYTGASGPMTEITKQEPPEPPTLGELGKRKLNV